MAFSVAWMGDRPSTSLLNKYDKPKYNKPQIVVRFGSVRGNLRDPLALEQSFAEAGDVNGAVQPPFFILILWSASL